MINDYPNKFMPQSVEELPNLVGAEDIFADFETTSGDDKKNSLNPWKDCDILGIGITVDQDPNSYYVPLRHRDSPYNLPIEPVYKWFKTILRRGKRWINHNVKYDAQVGINCADIDISHLELCDTVTLAKLIDSDRFRFSLEALSKDWLDNDISEFNNALKVYTHTAGGNWKIYDYGVIPADVMYPYGCQDTLSERDLWHYCMNVLPEDCYDVWEAEKELTKILLQIERNGLHIDLEYVVRDAFKNLKRMQRLKRLLQDEIQKEFGQLHGGEFRPHVNEDCEEVLIIKLGLPVLETSDRPPYKPSFGKATLKAYMVYPGVPKRIINGILWYRYYHKLQTSFTLPYAKKHINEVIHPSFNQTVRTGRLSCSEPNMMQLSPSAKRYVVPSAPDECLIELDLSQIEYRYIAHYIDNKRIIEEYQENPDTDFHQIMADLCGIKRKPAKAINFGVSFGAGKKKTIMMLKAAFDPEDTPEGYSFEEYCDIHGLQVYTDYHNRLPELRNTSKTAERVCKRRGYVRNVYGRRRYLPYSKSYRAFNTVIQSSAADFMKRVTIEVFKLTNGTSAKLLCLVHDSWVFSVPIIEKNYWIKAIKECIESVDSRMAVPIYSSSESSTINWRKCEYDPGYTGENKGVVEGFSEMGVQST